MDAAVRGVAIANLYLLRRHSHTAPDTGPALEVVGDLVARRKVKRLANRSHRRVHEHLAGPRSSQTCVDTRTHIAATYHFRYGDKIQFARRSLTPTMHSTMQAPVPARAILFGRRLSAICLERFGKGRRMSQRGNVVSDSPVAVHSGNAYASQDAGRALAAAIAKARGRAGLTQEEVAQRMRTTQSNIARLEAGRTIPSTRTLTKFADAIGARLKITFERSGQ